MQLIVQSNGTVHCLYGEELDLDLLGLLKISRGSLVEPTLMAAGLPTCHLWMALCSGHFNLAVKPWQQNANGLRGTGFP